MKGPAIIAVAGCSGSGKTTLAEELARELEGTHLELDCYYRDLARVPLDQRLERNFDHPDELDLPLLLAHLRQLQRGEPVERPVYDFRTCTRLPERTERVEERYALIVEGIFALCFPALRALTDFGIYVDTPDAVCYERRLTRDVRERGRTPESVAEHYAKFVRPAAETFIRPSGSYADLVVDGAASLDWAVEQALAAIEARGLLDEDRESEREQPIGFS